MMKKVGSHAEEKANSSSSQGWRAVGRTGAAAQRQQAEERAHVVGRLDALNKRVNVLKMIEVKLFSPQNDIYELKKRVG